MTRFGIVCPGWNCSEWVARSLHSVQRQTYPHFKCVVVDDMSSDGTFETAQAAVAGDPRFTVLRNETRQYPLGSIVKASRLAVERPEDVLVIVDADDWLKHDGALQFLADLYADPSVWLSYGSNELLNKPWRERLLGRTVRGQAAPFPSAISQRNLYRYMLGPYLAVHLRSYRKFLWDALRDEDLRDDHGGYFRACADPATMWPMMEMATERHIRYVHEILYVYNNGHALNERGRQPWHQSEQFITAVKIRARPAYQPLRLPEALRTFDV